MVAVVLMVSFDYYKKGKEGKAKVSASANFTIAEPSELLNMMSLREHALYRNSRQTDEKTGSSTWLVTKYVMYLVMLQVLMILINLNPIMCWLNETGRKKFIKQLFSELFRICKWWYR